MNNDYIKIRNSQKKYICLIRTAYFFCNVYGTEYWACPTRSWLVFEKIHNYCLPYLHCHATLQHISESTVEPVDSCPTINVVMNVDVQCDVTMTVSTKIHDSAGSIVRFQVNAMLQTLQISVLKDLYRIARVSFTDLCIVRRLK